MSLKRRILRTSQHSPELIEDETGDMSFSHLMGRKGTKKITHSHPNSHQCGVVVVVVLYWSIKKGDLGKA